MLPIRIFNDDFFSPLFDHHSRALARRENDESPSNRLWYPVSDMQETSDAYRVQIELPGMKKKM
eukprot:GABW01000625.1.p1 GENE.GABW01000625.1~~GABW01000625.1.p1  ORF type:complete len:64 (+),score=15.27 GABW01000625.1:115-306(+)